MTEEEAIRLLIEDIDVLCVCASTTQIKEVKQHVLAIRESGLLGPKPAPKVKAFNDTTPMPFGKYASVPLMDVPASYLHWLWTNEANPMHGRQAVDPLAAYIYKNVGSLAKEHPDGVW